MRSFSSPRSRISSILTTLADSDQRLYVLRPLVGLRVGTLFLTEFTPEILNGVEVVALHPLLDLYQGTLDMVDAVAVKGGTELYRPGPDQELFYHPFAVLYAGGGRKVNIQLSREEGDGPLAARYRPWPE